jgi:hypothetical protein
MWRGYAPVVVAVAAIVKQTTPNNVISVLYGYKEGHSVSDRQQRDISANISKVR